MRLPQRFYRLPVRFDVDRLRAEIAQIPADAWVAHPTGEPGNSAVRLISVGGGDNDQMHGAMGMTRYLERLPYVRQVLAGFGVAWSRSRLLRLAPRAEVKTHADIYRHWFYRTRVHIPIKTLPAVEFTCDGESVHMAAGECWIFDNWRQHVVRNPTDIDRIHLVLHGEDPEGRTEFVALRERVRERSQAISTGLIMRTNHVTAQRLLEARILRVCVLGQSPAPGRAHPSQAAGALSAMDTRSARRASAG
jgi:hypothetical protein